MTPEQLPKIDADLGVQKEADVPDGDRYGLDELEETGGALLRG